MKPLNHKKNWTSKDDGYLEESWGLVSLETITNNLQRTEGSVRKRANMLGLGMSRYAGGLFYSPPQIADLLGKDRGEIYDLISIGIIKGRRRKLVNERAYQVHLDDLMEFLKNHPDKWDSRKVPKYTFGEESDWLKEKRKADKKVKRHRNPWTDAQRTELMSLVRRGKTMKEISKIIGRTVNGVYQETRRLREQGKLSPVKIQLPWTDKEWQMVLDLEKQGYQDKEIAYELGREDYHIRDKRRLMRRKGLYQGYKKGYRKGVIL